MVGTPQWPFVSWSTWFLAMTASMRSISASARCASSAPSRPARAAASARCVARVPVLGAAPDEARDLVRVLDAVAELLREHAHAGEAVDVRLVRRRHRAAALAALVHGIGARPAERELEELGDAVHVRHEITWPERVDAVEELGRADRDRIDGAEAHLEIVVALPRGEARRGEIRPRAAERPEDVDRERHATAMRLRTRVSGRASSSSITGSAPTSFASASAAARSLAPRPSSQRNVRCQTQSG